MNANVGRCGEFFFSGVFSIFPERNLVIVNPVRRRMFFGSITSRSTDGLGINLAEYTGFSCVLESVYSDCIKSLQNGH
jgi:hypothetical protein